MNDFTKEELEYLYEAAETEVKYFDDSHIGHSLLLKIQTMIDNYCEHDFEYKDIGKAKLCTKCFSLLPIVKVCIEASTEPA